MTTPNPHPLRRSALQQLQEAQAYATAAHSWIEEMVRDQSNVDFFPFALNTDSREFKDGSTTNWLLNSDRIRRRELTKACEAATRRLNPTFSRNNPSRHDPLKSVRVLYLAAYKDSQCHLHGYLGIPRVSSELGGLWIWEKGVSRLIRGPIGLRYVVNAIKWRLQTANIWVKSEGGIAITDLDQDFASLDYLAPTWREERKWDEFELLPSHVRRKLASLQEAA